MVGSPGHASRALCWPSREHTHSLLPCCTDTCQVIAMHFPLLNTPQNHQLDQAFPASCAGQRRCQAAQVGRLAGAGEQLSLFIKQQTLSSLPLGPLRICFRLTERGPAPSRPLEELLEPSPGFGATAHLTLVPAWEAGRPHDSMWSLSPGSVHTRLLAGHRRWLQEMGVLSPLGPSIKPPASPWTQA